MTQMNPILDKIITARKGHYCHCVEVSDVYELENIAESLFNEFKDEFEPNVIIDFLKSLQVIALDDSNESEIYEFDFAECVNDMI